MDVNDPRFEDYELRFRALAEHAEHVKVAEPSLSSVKLYLCLYGENGLEPDDEFKCLDELAKEADQQLKRVEVESNYWQDTVLFIP